MLEVVTENRPTRRPDAAPPLATEHFTPVPARWIGALLDHGKASAHAVRLLCIKLREASARRGGYTLNRTHAARKYRVGSHQFNDGLRVLRLAGVLDRAQPQKNRYAVEALVLAPGWQVRVPDSHLDQSAPVLAFALAVQINPAASLATEVARRIGVASPKTVKRLVDKAEALGVAATKGPIGRIYVARSRDLLPVSKIDTASKINTAKIDTAQSYQEEHRVIGKEEQKEHLGQHTRSSERGATEVILRHWRLASVIGGRDERGEGLTYTQQDAIADDLQGQFSRARWIEVVDRLGPAPSHLKTAFAHLQALDICRELVALADGWLKVEGAMLGLAGLVSSEHRDGKEIRSLAYLAERLFKRIENGDDAWTRDLPSTLDDGALHQARRYAEAALAVAADAGTPCVRNDLCSTLQLEELHARLKRFGWQVFRAAVATEEKPAENRVVCGWSYFDQAAARVLNHLARQGGPRRSEHAHCMARVAPRRARVSRQKKQQQGQSA